MSTLSDLYNSHYGKVSTKWGSYLKTYEYLFKEYKNIKISLLEIGIQNGGSLEIWGKYFKEAQRIIGLDIDARCCQLQFTDQRITTIIGNPFTDDVRQYVKKQGALDIIIDDGSHISEDIILGFLNYFPLLNPGGLYIIEDLHRVYRSAHNESYIRSDNAIAFFRKLQDSLNFDFIDQKLRINLFNEFEGKYWHANNLPYAMNPSLTHSVTFLNSMIVIRKASHSYPAGLGNLIKVGHTEIIKV